MYDPARGFTVYEYKEWWSSAWDGLSYGRDYDLSQSFFSQFVNLRSVVPRFNLFNRDCENCDFVNYAPHCKNGYLIFGSWFSQDCYYGQSLNECRDSLDSLFLDRSELCYENIDCGENYNALFCQNSTNTVDSYFCFDCHNVKNCIGCFNLRDKEWHIENKPVSREAFQELRSKFASYTFLSSYQSAFIKKRREEAIHRAFTGIHNENIMGDFIYNSKNAQLCFSAYRSEDIAYCSRIYDAKNCYDVEGGGKGELTYESMSNDFAYFSLGCTTCENLKESHYCDLCFNCNNCFGCIGLKNAEYCILNKQYTKEAYLKLVPQIIEAMTRRGEWGEFFPIPLSSFAYNETLAQEYFPLTKEKALSFGYPWKDQEVVSEPQKIQLPDRITDTTETIMKEILSCLQCTKNYKIIPQEFKYQKQAGIPLPRLCPDCRHTKRMKTRNERRLWKRQCGSCHKEIQTSYNPDNNENVFCVECYQKALW